MDQPWRRLFEGKVGYIFILGVITAGTLAAVIGCAYFIEPELFQLLAGMSATHVLFGRAAGMSFGYALELGHGWVITVNMLIETALVLMFYPLFVLSWRHLFDFPRLKPYMQQVHETANRHQNTIRRYGIIGLFAFVWFPFWLTGPVVGCVIGFLLGLPAVVNLCVVLAGTYVAIMGWAMALHALHQKVAVFSPYAPLVLLGIIILLASALRLFTKNNKGHASQ